MTEFVVAIPARYAASRLPGTPPRPLGGDPLALPAASRHARPRDAEARAPPPV